MKGSLRKHAEPIIARVLTETAGQTEKEIKQALHDAYPFGPRSHYPYKIWLHEIKRQRKRLALRCKQNVYQPTFELFANTDSTE